MTPPSKPMATADNGLTKPAAGVIETSPAMQPLAAPSTVGLPCINHSANTQETVAAAAETCVTTNALEAISLAPSALPALKPNQPNQSKPAPSTVIGKWCGNMTSLP